MSLLSSAAVSSRTTMKPSAASAEAAQKRDRWCVPFLCRACRRAYALPRCLYTPSSACAANLLYVRHAQPSQIHELHACKHTYTHTDAQLECSTRHVFGHVMHALTHSQHTPRTHHHAAVAPVQVCRLHPLCSSGMSRLVARTHTVSAL